MRFRWYLTCANWDIHLNASSVHHLSWIILRQNNEASCRRNNYLWYILIIETRVLCGAGTVYMNSSVVLSRIKIFHRNKFIMQGLSALWAQVHSLEIQSYPILCDSLQWKFICRRLLRRRMHIASIPLVCRAMPYRRPYHKSKKLESR